MSTYRVVVSDQVFPDTDTERALLAEIDAELEVADGTNEDIVERGRDADALLTTFAPFDAATIGQLGACRIIARYGIGVDNVDLDAARDAGIAVTNVPDYCVEEVAVHTVALALAAHRKLLASDRLVRDGGWGIGSLRPMPRLSELTVGLVGYGQIARRVGAAFAGFGSRIVAADPYVDDPGDGTTIVELDELFATADIISVHAPLTPQTRGLVGADQLRAMKDDALLVNTSRGPLVVLDDLLEALHAGTIGGAALDVVEQEPPADPAALDAAPNLLLSPHSAFYSDAAIRESQTKAATQVVKALRGEPLDYPVT